MYLREHPLCVHCEAEGVVRLAEELHHIIKLRVRPDLKFEETNILGLCHEHHAALTTQGL
jgi:5-methylcytosine-specific restriction enzyme A